MQLSSFPCIQAHRRGEQPRLSALFTSAPCSSSNCRDIYKCPAAAACEKQGRRLQRLLRLSSNRYKDFRDRNTWLTVYWRGLYEKKDSDARDIWLLTTEKFIIIYGLCRGLYKKKQDSYFWGNRDYLASNCRGIHDYSMYRTSAIYCTASNYLPLSVPTDCRGLYEKQDSDSEKTSTWLIIQVRYQLQRHQLKQDGIFWDIYEWRYVPSAENLYEKQDSGF